jgi:hypothetical protein
MVQYIFTPWRDQRELLAVRRQFYPDRTIQSTQAAAPSFVHTSAGDDEQSRPEHRQQAVSRVSMWMHRGNCPHLVESTALLTTAWLLDHEQTRLAEGSTSSSTEYAVRAAYSTAFSRYVA